MAEQLGEATLDLAADLTELDRDLALAEMRVASAVTRMQAQLDRLTLRINQQLGSISIDRSLTVPITGLGDATILMGQRVDRSLAQLRSVQAQTTTALERTTQATVRSADTQVRAADRTKWAYVQEAEAAKATADAVRAIGSRAPELGTGRPYPPYPNLLAEVSGRSVVDTRKQRERLEKEMAGVPGEQEALIEAERALREHHKLPPMRPHQIQTAQRIDEVERLAREREIEEGPIGREVAAMMAVGEARRTGGVRLEVADRLRKGGPPAPPTPSTHEPAAPAIGVSGVWGVRGPRQPGSIANPLTVAIEAGQRTPLGAMAAAVGEAPWRGGAAETTIVQGGAGEGAGTTIVRPTGGGEARRPAVAVGGAGGGGGEEPPIAPPAGGEGHALPPGGGRDRGLLRKALWGGGAAAGIGTLGAFAGLGLDRALFTGLGLAGSAGAAVGGAGVMGLGALGQFAVGSGSNLLVMRSTIEGTTELQKATEKLDHATELYGAHSKQAVIAERERAVVLKELGGGPGPAAQLKLAEAKMELADFWQEQSSVARVQAAGILMQFVELAHNYTPRVANAARENLTIINQGIRPLFDWLKGPEGVGTFHTLENAFRSNLPHAVHAFTQGVELLLKTMASASQYTGGITRHIDAFLTRVNSPQGFAVWQDEMRRLVDTTKLWAHFLHLVGQDIVLLFRSDAGLGNSIIGTLSKALEKVREYERSTHGKEQIRNIFQLHKEEVLALLHAVGALLGPFGNLYLTLVPLAVPVVTALAEAVGWLVKGITSLGPAASTLLGMALIMAKLGVLVPVITALSGAFKGLGVSQGQAAAAAAAEARAEVLAAGATAADAEAAAAAAAANTGLAAAQGGAATKGLPGLLGKGAATGIGSKLVKGAGYGALAAFGVDTALHIAGVKGPADTILPMAAGGAALGLQFGGPFGAAAGGLIGGGIGAAITLFNHKAPDYGKKFAAGFVAPLAPMLTEKTAQQLQEELDHERNKAKAAHLLSKKLREEEAHPSPHAVGERDFAGEKAKAFQQGFLAELREGMTAAEGLKRSFSGVSQKTVAAFVMDTVQGLRKLSGEARGAAGQAMVAWAKELESKGQLPRGALHKVLAALMAQFPDFARYMSEHALSTSASMAAAMKMEAAKTNLAASLQSLRAEWGLFNVSPVVTGKNWLHNLGITMKDLKALLAAEPGNKVLEQHLKDLQKNAAGTFYDMLRSTKTQMHTFGQLVKGGMASARPEAEKELAAFNTAVQNGVNGGVLTMQQGAVLMRDAANAFLKNFGAAELPPVHLSKALVSGGKTSKAGTLGAQSEAFGGKGLAGGGLVQFGRQGERGQDTIPMRMGGTDIVVGGGEVGMVANAQQQAYLNQKLAAEGGLSGFFAMPWKPHYMAKGGFVPAVASAESLGGTGYRGNPIQARGYSELSVPPSVAHAGTALGSLPYLTHMRIRAGTHEVVAAKQDIGAGSSFNPVMGLYPGTIADLGLSGGEFHVMIQRADGQPLTGGALRAVAAAVKHVISAPGVKGVGPIAAMVRAGLRKVAAAATTYLGSHAPAGGPGLSAAPGGRVPTGGGFDPAQLGTFDGLQVAKWIIPELQYARAHGWKGHITSGYRGGFDPHAPGGSMHALDIYPGGAVDFGGMIDPAGAANAAAFVRATAGYRGKRLLSPIGFRDDGHMSGTGHARGGLIPGFARGGIISAQKGLRKTSPFQVVGAPRPPHPRTPVSTKVRGRKHVPRGRGAPKPVLEHLITSLSEIPGMAGITKALGVPEGTANLLTDEFTLLGNMTGNTASLLPADMQYLGPTLLPGETLQPFELVTHAERTLQRMGQGLEGTEDPLVPKVTLQGSLLSQIAGLDDHRLLSSTDIGALRVDFQRPNPDGGRSLGVELHEREPVFAARLHVLEAQRSVQELLAAIMGRQKARADRFIKVRTERRNRLKKLAGIAYQRYRQIKRQIEALTTGSLRRHLSEAEHNKIVQDQIKGAEFHRHAVDEAIREEVAIPFQDEHSQAAIKALRAERDHINGFILSLRKPSSAGVHSAQEALTRNLLERQMKPVEDSLQRYGGSRTSIGSGGEIGVYGKEVKGLEGGSRELTDHIRTSTQTTVPGLTLEIEQIKLALQEAAEAVRPILQQQQPGKPPAETELAALWKQKAEQEALGKAVAEAQFKTLQQFYKAPPFGGHFAEGGVVPGPAGSPKTIIAHGKEVVSKGSGRIEVVVQDGAVDPNKIAVIADGVAQRVTRGIGRNVFRGLPSRGGGLGAG